ncbi:hypothetical protein AJ79_00675 [Helicocarpus griseus UAMH5409]|uniref:Uncharacterized protein n=1 Tax=Helicocarpus griseus UAMH5409 TaxID=1447875 RepID=A0A2B7YAC5_9EURO|nr:hypothetical protein AJ79_00675 [Helicocarpus griseus UAMH5409]
MTWYSLLPPGLTAFETWLVRVFVILGTIMIAPWAFLILYDILLYVWRASTYEIPIIGGRARGRQRPQAPSFSERPDGRRRTFSLTGSLYDGHDGQGEEEQEANDEGYQSGAEDEKRAFDDFADFGDFGKFDGGGTEEEGVRKGGTDERGVRYRKVYAEPDGIIDGDAGG